MIVSFSWLHPVKFIPNKKIRKMNCFMFLHLCYFKLYPSVFGKPFSGSVQINELALSKKYNGNPSVGYTFLNQIIGHCSCPPLGQSKVIFSSAYRAGMARNFYLHRWLLAH